MKKILNSKYLLFASLLISTALIIQCNKNEDINLNQTNVKYVSGGICGTVLNDLGEPEANVSVSYGTTNVLTDKNGIFVLQNQLLDEAGAQVKFSKQGYFTVYKTVLPIKNKMVSQQVILIPKVITKTVNSVTGDIIVVYGNAQITLLPNSIVDANGKLYNGSVNVYAHWIDPFANEYTAYQMPGDLTGRDHLGKQVILQTLGMLMVELEDVSGNPLNIASGKTAELKFPIDASQNNIAQATIPMWYYNASLGGWIEEGIANRQGSDYIANVKHFSTWNFDYSYPTVKVSGRVLDKSGNAIANVLVQINNDKTNWPYYCTTTGDGYFVGRAPELSACSVEVNPNNCQFPFTENFTSSTSDINLGDIISNIKSTKLTAHLLDCNENKLNNGYLILQTSESIKDGNRLDVNIFLFADADGAISGHLCTCDSTAIYYKAVDIPNLKESTRSLISFNNQTELDLGQIKACNTLNDYILVKVNGVQRLFINGGCSSAGQELLIFGLSDANDSSYVNIRLSGINLNVSQFPVSFDLQGPLGNYYFYNCPNGCKRMNLKITQFGAIGEQVIGEFNGILNDFFTLKDETVSGNFSVERKN